MSMAKLGILAAATVLIANGGIVQDVRAADFVAKIGHLESAAQSRHIHLEKVGELVCRTHRRRGRISDLSLRGKWATSVK